MKRMIRMIFGKPYDNKILKFHYWFGVIGYMLGIPIIIFVAFLVDDIFGSSLDRVVSTEKKANKSISWAN